MALLRFSVPAEQSPAFRQALRNAGIPCKMQQVRGGIYYAEIAAHHRRKLLRLAAGTNTDLQILRETGIRQRLLPYRKRLGLLLGALLGCAFLYWCNATVRSIEINGNTRISDDELLLSLESLGITRGTCFRDIPYTYIEQRLRLAVSDIEWVRLRQQGGRLIVDLTEERLPPEIVNDRIPTNVIAAVSAQITSVNVLGGHAVCQAGDTVRAGDLLITGVQADSRGITRYYHADGIVTGIYGCTFTAEQPFVQELPVRGRTESETLLELFGKRFSVSPAFSPPDYDALIYEEDRRPLYLFGRELPLSLICCRYTEAATAITAFSEQELRTLLEEDAARYERNFHAEDTLIAREAEFSRSDLGISLKINYIFEGVIGKTSEIFVKSS